MSKKPPDDAGGFFVALYSVVGAEQVPLGIRLDRSLHVALTNLHAEVFLPLTLGLGLLVLAGFVAGGFMADFGGSLLVGG